MTPEQERELRRRAERLASLQKHPGFMLLVEEAEKKRLRMKDGLATRLLDGREDIGALREQATYDRGFYDGVVYGQKIVIGAERKLQEWDAGQEVTEPEEEIDGWASYGI
jgi:hypothetical protein